MMEHDIRHSWSTMHWETTVTQVTCLSEGLPELLHITVYLILTMVPHFLYLPMGTLQGWPILGNAVCLSSLFPLATSCCLDDREQPVSLNILIFTFAYVF